MIFVFLIPVLLFLSIEAVSVLFGFTLPSLSVCIQRSSSHIARHVKHQNDAGILPRIVSLKQGKEEEASADLQSLRGVGDSSKPVGR